MYKIISSSEELSQYNFYLDLYDWISRQCKDCFDQKDLGTIQSNVQTMMNAVREKFPNKPPEKVQAEILTVLPLVYETYLEVSENGAGSDAKAYSDPFSGDDYFAAFIKELDQFRFYVIKDLKEEIQTQERDPKKSEPPDDSAPETLEEHPKSPTQIESHEGQFQQRPALNIRKQANSSGTPAADQAAPMEPGSMRKVKRKKKVTKSLLPEHALPVHRCIADKIIRGSYTPEVNVWHTIFGKDQFDFFNDATDFDTFQRNLYGLIDVFGEIKLEEIKRSNKRAPNLTNVKVSQRFQEGCCLPYKLKQLECNRSQFDVWAKKNGFNKEDNLRHFWMLGAFYAILCKVRGMATESEGQKQLFLGKIFLNELRLRKENKRIYMMDLGEVDDPDFPAPAPLQEGFSDAIKGLYALSRQVGKFSGLESWKVWADQCGEKEKVVQQGSLTKKPLPSQTVKVATSKRDMEMDLWSRIFILYQVQNHDEVKTLLTREKVLDGDLDVDRYFILLSHYGVFNSEGQAKIQRRVQVFLKDPESRAVILMSERKPGRVYLSKTVHYDFSEIHIFGLLMLHCKSVFDIGLEADFKACSAYVAIKEGRDLSLLDFACTLGVSDAVQRALQLLQICGDELIDLLREEKALSQSVDIGKVFNRVQGKKKNCWIKNGDRLLYFIIQRFEGDLDHDYSDILIQLYSSHRLLPLTVYQCGMKGKDKAIGNLLGRVIAFGNDRVIQGIATALPVPVRDAVIITSDEINGELQAFSWAIYLGKWSIAGWLCQSKKTVPVNLSEAILVVQKLLDYFTRREGIEIRRDDITIFENIFFEALNKMSSENALSDVVIGKLLCSFDLFSPERQEEIKSIINAYEIQNMLTKVCDAIYFQGKYIYQFSEISLFALLCLVTPEKYKEGLSKDLLEVLINPYKQAAKNEVLSCISVLEVLCLCGSHQAIEMLKGCFNPWVECFVPEVALSVISGGDDEDLADRAALSVISMLENEYINGLLDTHGVRVLKFLFSQWKTCEDESKWKVIPILRVLNEKRLIDESLLFVFIKNCMLSEGEEKYGDFSDLMGTYFVETSFDCDAGFREIIDIRLLEEVGSEGENQKMIIVLKKKIKRAQQLMGQ